MANQLSSRSDLTETLAIHIALKAARKTGKFKEHAAVKKAADRLCSELESGRSIYGRQLKMIGLMEKGASLVDLSRKLRCSRRTVFRYLNHLEDAGIHLKLEGVKYHVDRGVARMLRG